VGVGVQHLDLAAEPAEQVLIGMDMVPL
jgi:hypothetical protein